MPISYIQFEKLLMAAFLTFIVLFLLLLTGYGDFNNTSESKEVFQYIQVVEGVGCNDQ